MKINRIATVFSCIDIRIYIHFAASTRICFADLPLRLLSMLQIRSLPWHLSFAAWTTQIKGFRRRPLQLSPELLLPSNLAASSLSLAPQTAQQTAKVAYAFRIPGQAMARCRTSFLQASSDKFSHDDFLFPYLPTLDLSFIFCPCMRNQDLQVFRKFSRAEEAHGSAKVFFCDKSSILEVVCRDWKMIVFFQNASFGDFLQ